MKPSMLTPIAASLMLCFATLSHADQSATSPRADRDGGDRLLAAAGGDPQPDRLPGPPASPTADAPEGAGLGAKAAARKYDRSGPPGRDVTRGVYEPEDAESATNLGKRAAEKRTDPSGPARETLRETTRTTERAQDRAEGGDPQGLARGAAARKYDTSGPADDGRTVPGGPSTRLQPESKIE